MTPALRVTLRAEGSSDGMLLPIIRWTLRRHLGEYPIDDRLADWASVRPKPAKLSEQILRAVQLFPCDVLFVHRDADKYDPAIRRAEISEAIAELDEEEFTVPHVCVIPIRESEAWALFDEGAIRAAAANRHGKVRLSVPKLGKIESISDPKVALRNLIRTASEQSGRGLDKLMQGFRPRDVIDWIDDFSPLLNLPAFQEFDGEVGSFVESWQTPSE